MTNWWQVSEREKGEGVKSSHRTEKVASWRSLWVPWERGKLWEGVLYGKLRKGGGSGRSNVSSFSSHWHPQTFTDAKELITATALISP